MRPAHPRLAALLAALPLVALLATGLVACQAGTPEPTGSPTETTTTGTADPTTQSPAAPDPETPPTGTAYPLTLDSPFGSSVLEERPERVAVVSYTTDLADVLALGVTPVLTVAHDQPWITEHPAYSGIETIPWSRDLAFEQILAAGPEVIVSVANANLGMLFDRLVEIAPVVAYPGELGRQSIVDWRTTLTIIAEALDRTAEAEELIGQSEDILAATAAAHPEFAGKTIAALSNTGPDGGVVYLSFAGSSSEALFASLGFAAPEVATRFTAENNTLAPEQFQLLDVDVLLVVHYGDTQEWLEGQALFAELPVVRDGGYVAHQTMDGDGNLLAEEYYVIEALLAPSALSIQWAADRIPAVLAPAFAE